MLTITVMHAVLLNPNRALFDVCLEADQCSAVTVMLKTRLTREIADTFVSNLSATLETAHVQHKIVWEA